MSGYSLPYIPPDVDAVVERWIGRDSLRVIALGHICTVILDMRDESGYWAVDPPSIWLHTDTEWEAVAQTARKAVRSYFDAHPEDLTSYGLAKLVGSQP